MSLLNVSFVMIYIICKMLVLLKNHLSYLKDNIFKCFFKKYNKLLFKKWFFLYYIMMRNLRPEEENIVKVVLDQKRIKLHCI